jgi:hypothetical protein
MLGKCWFHKTIFHGVSCDLVNSFMIANNAALQPLHLVDVGHVANVSDEYAASRFKGQVSAHEYI